MELRFQDGSVERADGISGFVRQYLFGTNDATEPGTCGLVGLSQSRAEGEGSGSGIWNRIDSIGWVGDGGVRHA